MINQSVKSSFVKGAGAHPQNAPCRRRSHVLRSVPVRRDRLLSVTQYYDIDLDQLWRRQWLGAWWHETIIWTNFVDFSSNGWHWTSQGVLINLIRNICSEVALFRVTTLSPRGEWVNSLAPEKFESNFRYLILQIISVIDGWGISCELALRWMWVDLTDDKSTLVQVMAWCRQAISHYLSQCWPSFLSPYGITRP